MEQTQWFQSRDVVTVSVKPRAGTLDAVSADINERYCAVRCGDEVVWKGYLHHPINPDKSIVKVAGKRVELKLWKVKAEQWEVLEDHHHGDCQENAMSSERVDEMDVDGDHLKRLSSSTEDIFVTPSTSPSRDSSLTTNVAFCGSSISDVGNNVTDSLEQDAYVNTSSHTDVNAYSVLHNNIDSMDIDFHSANDVTRLSHVPHDMIDKGSKVLVKMMIPSVDTKSFHAVFKPHTLEVDFTTSDNRFLNMYPGSSHSTSFSWKVALFDLIVPEKCVYHVRPRDIALILDKHDSSVRWKALEALRRSSPSPLDAALFGITTATRTPIAREISEVNSATVPVSRAISATTEVPASRMIAADNSTSDENDSDDGLGQLNNLDAPEASTDLAGGNRLIMHSKASLNDSHLENTSLHSGQNTALPTAARLSHGSGIEDLSSRNDLSNPSQFIITHNYTTPKNSSPLKRNSSEGVIASASMTRGSGSSSDSSVASPKPHRSRFVRLSADLFKAPSLTGLTNMGNTCFMSSVVQCLSNTVEVRDYCLSLQYKKDINVTNPLGSQGRLMECFAKILDRLWSGSVEYFSASNLKALVASKSDRFQTHAQQDSHEFITFLLDGLHEDVNRVKEKPLTEPVSSNGRSDSEVAAESWDIYKKRNDSFFVDLFAGQFKSTLVCPVCSKVSVTFDPFMSMSVPLPKKMRTITAIFFPQDFHAHPKELLLNLPPDSNLELLKASIARKTNVPMPQLRVFNICDGRAEDMQIQTQRSIKIIHCNDTVIAYDVLYYRDVGEEVTEMRFIQRLRYPPLPERCSECRQASADLKRCTRCGLVAYCNRSCQTQNWPLHKHCCRPGHLTKVGVPFVVSLPISQLTYANLSRHARRMANFSVECKRANDGIESCSNGREPMFNLVPLDEDESVLAGAGPLRDEGNKLILLPSKYLALDWRNNPRERDHVVVRVRDRMVYLKAEQKISTSSEKQIELEECLQLFTEPELLPSDNAWYCPRCKEHREATKQMSVWRLPHILIIHLKRFSFLNYVIRDKIEKLVNYPISGLDMSPYILGEAAARIGSEGPPPIYDLFAVINHYGNVYLGHNTATIRSPVGNREEWLLYDDEYVSRRINQSRYVVHESAYILFYQRRD